MTTTYEEGPSPSVASVHDKEPRGIHPIPVYLCDAVDTRPAKRSRMRNIVLSTTAASVIDFDSRYRRVWVSCATNNVILGTAAQVKGQSPDGFILPSNVTPIPWEGFDEEPVFAAAVTGTATLSLRFEFWAD